MLAAKRPTPSKSLHFTLKGANSTVVLLVLLSCFCIQRSHGQDLILIDSLAERYSRINGISEEKILLTIEMAKEYARFDSSMTFQLASEILSSSKEIKYENGEVQADGIIGSYYANIGRLDSARLYQSKSLEKAKSINFKGGMAASYQNLATVNEMEGQYGRATRYLDSALAVIRPDNSDKALLLKYNIYNSYGLIFYGKGSQDTALMYFQQALSIAEARNDKMTMGITYGNLGLVYDEKTDRVSAIENHKKSEELALEIGDTIGVAYSFLNQGLIYLALDEFDTARVYFNEAFQFFDRQNLVYEKSTCLSGLGYINEKEGNSSEALDIYLQAYRLDQEMGFVQFIIQREMSLSNLYLIRGELDSAAIYIDRAVNRIQLADAEGSLPECLVLKAQIAVQEGAFQEAFSMLEEAKVLAIKYGLLDQQVASLKWLSFVKEQKAEYKEAFAYQKEYIQLSDSLNSDELARKIARAENKYELDKNQRSISLLTRENEIARAEQEIKEGALRRQNQRNLMIAGSVGSIILVIAVFMYSQYRQRNRYASIVEEKNEQLSETMAAKEKLFSIIAHDLKSPLSAFSSISSTLADNIASFEKDQIAVFLKKFEKSSQNLTSLLNNLLQWSLSQTGSLKVQPEQINMKESMERAIKPLSDLAESKGIALTIETDAQTVVADVRMVETIIRNLVSNALKFTDKDGSVSLSSQKDQENLLISIQDSGIGMDDEESSRLFDLKYDPGKIGDHEEKGTGLGLILSKELVEKNKGVIGVRSEKNKGSTFFFTLPLAS